MADAKVCNFETGPNEIERARELFSTADQAAFAEAVLQFQTIAIDGEAQKPFVSTPSGLFLWGMRNHHYHPLLKHYKEGMILVSKLPTSSEGGDPLTSHVERCRQAIVEKRDDCHQTEICGVMSSHRMEALLGRAHVPQNSASVPLLFTYATLQHRLVPVSLELSRMLVAFLAMNRSNGLFSPIRVPIVFYVSDDRAERFDWKSAEFDHIGGEYCRSVFFSVGDSRMEVQTSPTSDATHRNDEKSGFPFGEVISTRVPIEVIRPIKGKSLTLAEFMAPYMIDVDNPINIETAKSLTFTPMGIAARYDALWGSPAKREKSANVSFLKKQATLTSPTVMSGPLLSLAVFWDVKEPNIELMEPYLPNPNPTNTDAVMLIRSGTAEEPLLSPYWSDLKLLRRLVEISDEQESLDQTMAPLHNHGDLDMQMGLEAGSVKSHSGGKVEPLIHHEELFGHQPFSKGEAMALVLAFVDEERRLAVDVVRRPGMVVAQGRDSSGTSFSNSSRGLGAGRTQTGFGGSSAQNAQISQIAATRPNKEFVDRLWQFLKRSHDFHDMRDALEQVVDSLDPFSRGTQSQETQSLEEVLMNQESRDIISKEARSAQRPPLLPVVRRDNETGIAQMVKLAVRAWQLQRYGGQPDNSLTECENQWAKCRKDLCNVPCVAGMMVELGFECLEQDLTFLINQACPSTSGELEYLLEAGDMEERLNRLAQLIKVCEIALLAQKAHLPWDLLRRVVRHAAKYYETHSHLSGPLFACPLNRIAGQEVVQFWVWRLCRTPTLLTVTSNGTQAEFTKMSDGERTVYEDRKASRKFASRMPVFLWETEARPDTNSSATHLSTEATSKLSYALSLVTREVATGVGG
eukprot:GHVN01000556.1.p1 GENE.GHVN01000556.1~~GHVN01000556.1.p1  ORF type:complete len:859 (+),score=102.98 GHVN01000556.1:1496-4072(+)